jgi:Activator of Hsp90 ATPase homolog 1-like protein
VGGAFQLFDDYVIGEIVECDAPHKLAQTWKPNDWTIEDSVVSFTLTKTRGGTRVDVVHENVQPEDYEGTSNGWNEFYVGAIKAMLESETPKPKPKQVRRAARQKKAAANAKRAPRKTRTVGAPKKKKAPMKRKKTGTKK